MEIKKVIDEFKNEIKKIYDNNLLKVILYGSWARNEATENSDIDLLVILKGKIIPGKEIDRMIDIITELNLKYDVLLSIYPISEKDYSSAASPFLVNIHKEGVLA